MDSAPSADGLSVINFDDTGEGNLEENQKTNTNPTKFSQLRKWFQRVFYKCFVFSQRMVLPRSQWPDAVDGEYEDQYSCSPPTFAILMLTAVEVSVFIYYVSTQGDKVPNSPLIYDPTKRDEVWRFVSYMLIHASYEHILCNVVLQLFLGIPLEMVHKFWRVCTIYLSGVLAGSLATSVCDPATYLVGASGGVYALITAHVASIIMNFKEIELYPVAQLVFFIVIMAVDVGIAIYNRYSLTNDRTAYVAHLAGALAGLLLGIVALRNLRTHKWERVLWWLCLDTLVIVMATMIIWNVAAPSYFPPAT